MSALSRRLTILLIIWVSTLPLVSWNGWFEVPKMMVFWTGSLVLFAHLAIKKELPKNMFLPKNILYGLWLIIGLFASFGANNVLDSLIGGSYRKQGLVFFFGMFVLGKTIFSLSKKDKLTLVKFLSITTLVISVAIFYQKLQNKYLLATIGEPNAVASIISLGVVYFFLEKTTNFSLTFFIFSVLSILFIGSLSGFFVLVVLFPLSFLAKRAKSKIFLVIVSLIAISLPIVGALFKKDAPYFESRLQFWKYATSAIEQKPYLGYGFESQELIYEKAYKKDEVPLDFLIVDRAHNLFLDVILWTGILGLFSFFGWLFFELKDLVLGKKYLQFGSILALLAYSMIQPLSIIHWLYLFVFLNI